MPKRRRLPVINSALCLGLVVVPHPGQREAAMASLRRHGALELGEPQGHRIPACTITQAGRDEELLAELARLDGVLSVEVVFAQTVEDEAA